MGEEQFSYWESPASPQKSNVAFFSSFIKTVGVMNLLVKVRQSRFTCGGSENLQDAVPRRQPETRSFGSQALDHSNTSAHTALPIKQLLD
jgi:hypothetical protein